MANTVAIRRLRFEVEILQHVFVVENVVYMPLEWNVPVRPSYCNF